MIKQLAHHCLHVHVHVGSTCTCYMYMSPLITIEEDILIIIKQILQAEMILKELHAKMPKSMHKTVLLKYMVDNIKASLLTR